MTAPLAQAFDFEEPQEVPASHLMRCACCACGSETLAAPGQTQNARCASCAGAGLDGGAYVGPYTPGRLLTPLRPSQAVVERPEVREPVSVCGEVCGHTVPTPVVDLVRVAHRASWLVAVGHSVGGVMGGAGKQLADAELWGVRFASTRGAGFMGYAVRRGDTWESVCVAGATLPPYMGLGVTELREWLEQPEREAGWYDAVRQRRAAQALASKNVKCPGPGACEWVDGQRGEHTHRANGDIKIKTRRAGAAGGKREHGG